MVAVGWAEVSTGQVVEDASIMKEAARLRYRAYGSSPFGRRWIKVSQVALATLAKLGLGILETRIFLFVCSSLRDGNLIDVSQASLARELGSYSSNVSVALGSLVAANVLERIDGAPGSQFTVYHVSPHLAWYGPDNKAHSAACAAAPPLRPVPAKPAPSKVDKAIRQIAKTARSPIAMTTGAALLDSRTIERDDYSQA